MTNALYYGDNLDILRRYIDDDSVDLVYLDPPFQSGRDYNVLFDELDGTQAAAQIQAFEDTWTWDERSAASYDSVVREGGSVARTLEAFHQMLGGSPMLAYVSMMAPRLIELRRVLAPTGSIYLHCDQTASAHLRLLMDSIFGPKNFRNEIAWYYYNKMHDSRKKLFARATDTLIFYTKDMNSKFYFKQLKEKRDKPVRQLKRKKVGGKMVNAKDEKGHVIYQIKKDRTIDNVWRIPCIQPADKTQRMGFQTQKPELLLERVIEASCPIGGVILDPFCGCGTSIAAAHKLERHWIGIDITHLAVGLIKFRLLHAFGLEQKDDYAVVGEPTTIEGAKQLAADNERHQFEHWALGLVGARASARGPGADKGMDGELYFQEGGTGTPHQRVIISIKSGHVSSRDVRDLVGAVQREKAVMGWFVTLEPISGPMKTEAADLGLYESPWGRHPKIQIRTVSDLLGGQKFDAPPIRQGGTTFRLPRRVEKRGAQAKLDI